MVDVYKRQVVKRITLIGCADCCIIVRAAAVREIAALYVHTPVSYTHLDVYKRQGHHYESNKQGAGFRDRECKPDSVQMEQFVQTP